jgi:hypothetical protein
VATVYVNEALASVLPGILSHVSSQGSAALRYEYATMGHVLGSLEILDTGRSLIASLRKPRPDCRGWKVTDGGVIPPKWVAS